MMLLNKKSLLGALLISIFFFCGCQKEIPSPAQKEQFIKNFGTGYNNNAIDFVVFENNFYILGNSSEKEGLSSIFLAKADEYGNQLWKKEYSVNSVSSMGNQLIKLEKQEGFAIVGSVLTDVIDKYSDICLLIVGNEGEVLKQQIYSDSLNQKGKCITELASGELFIAATQSINLTSVANKQLFMLTTIDGILIRTSPREGSNVNISGICNNSNSNSINDFIFVTGTSYNIPEIYLIKSDGTFYGTAKFKDNINWTINGIINDKQNKVFICGTQPNGSFGINDVFIAEIEYQNESENVIIAWQKGFGTENDDEGISINTTSGNNIIITGTTQNAQLNNDVYLIECTKTGSLVKSTFFGGSDNENGIKSVETNDNKITTLSTTYNSGSSAITLSKLNWK